MASVRTSTSKAATLGKREAWHAHFGNSAWRGGDERRICRRVNRVALADGREVSAPIAWFPRLRDASAEQRANWRLIGRVKASIGRTSTRTCRSTRCWDCRPDSEYIARRHGAGLTPPSSRKATTAALPAAVAPAAFRSREGSADPLQRLRRSRSRRGRDRPAQPSAFVRRACRTGPSRSRH